MPEPTSERPVREVEMPEKIKTLWDVAEQSGFTAAKGESDGSWKFIASSEKRELVLTIKPDGVTVDRFQVTDPKTKAEVGDIMSMVKLGDVFVQAGVNASVGVGSFLKIQPIPREGKTYAEQRRLKGMGITFVGEEGNLRPSTVRTATRAAEPAFAKVWDNDDDAAYDRL